MFKNLAWFNNLVDIFHFVLILSFALKKKIFNTVILNNLEGDYKNTDLQLDLIHPRINKKNNLHNHPAEKFHSIIIKRDIPCTIHKA